MSQAMAVSLSPAASSGGSAISIVLDLGQFLWTLFWIIVIVPIQLVIVFVVTLIATIITYLPLLLILLVAIFASGAWIKTHREVTRTLEEVWRCEIYPIFFGQIPELVDELAEPYEAGICYYNALAFTNRILSKKTVTKILAECPRPTSYLEPIFGVLKTFFRTLGAVGRWLPGFYKNKLPLFPTMTGMTLCYLGAKLS